MSSSKFGQKNWGAWTWSDEYQLYRRQRVDRRGVYHEEFADADGNPVSTQPDVSSLTQGFGSISLTEDPPPALPESSTYDYGASLGTGYGQPPLTSGYGDDPQYGTSAPQPRSTQPQQATKHGTSGHSKQPRTSTQKPMGRGGGARERQQFGDPFYSSSRPGGQAPEPAPEPSSDYSPYGTSPGDAAPADPATLDSAYDTTQQTYSAYEPISSGGQAWPQSGYGQSQAPQPKAKGSKQPKHGGSDYGAQPKQSSSFTPTQPVIASTQEAYLSGYGDPTYGQTDSAQPAAAEEPTTVEYASRQSAEYTSASTYPSGDDMFYGGDVSGTYGSGAGGGGGYTDAYSPYTSAYQPIEEDRARTPTQAASSVPRGPKQSDSRAASSQSGDPDELDVRFIVEPSWRFETGKVFKILWSEPIGAQATSSENRIQRTQWGEQFYICFRRFIVAKSDEGHSTCVPILTYEGRACTKRGVKADKHGVVHAVGTRPQKMKNEPDLGFTPVRMSLEAEGEKLAPQSRINYSKFQTIEHNMKVFFIGKIVHSDLEIFMDAIESCWTRKKGGGRHHRHR